MSTPQPSATLEEMLKLLGFSDVILSETLLEDTLVIDIQTSDSGRLIGRSGAVLADLQYLLNRMLFRGDDSAPRVMLDVGGYRLAAREALVQRAREAAEKVRRSGDIIELEPPMTAYDRRIVHQALREDSDVETHSVEVEGSDKKVVLLRPRRKPTS